jgi:Lar family restriction alleviation protein
MTKPKLKPCPFCGGNGEIVREVTEALTVWYFIRCLDCGATGSIEGEEPDNPDGGVSDATTAWNRSGTMSESKSGPFEDAVYILGRYMDNRLRGKEAAIRLLEAAGKINKVNALEGMEALRAMMSRELFMDIGPTFQSVCVLLEALPVEEEK